MQPASARFFAAINGVSHQVFSYVDVIGPDGRIARLNVTTGSVTVDRTADIRRQCSLTVVDPDGTITPKTATDILTPFGTEIRPYRGVKYPGGETEVVPLGVFRVSKVSVSDAQGATPQGGSTGIGVQGGGGGGGGSIGISIDAYDRSRTVARDGFQDVWTVIEGTNIVDAIKAILNRTFPDLTFDAVSTTLTATAPMVFDTGNNPWQACQTLATQIGCEVFFDPTGNVVIAPPVDVDHLPAPDWSYVEGDGNCALALGVVYTDEPGYNGVVLTGESTGDETPAVRSVAWDDQPSSPTYYKGPYGAVPQFVSNSVVSTQADADSVAQSLLNQLVGVTQQLSVTSLVNPALDVNDTILVVRAQDGLNTKYAIDSITIPLDAGSSSDVTLRQKRVRA